MTIPNRRGNIEALFVASVKTAEHPAGGVPTRPLVSWCEVDLSPQGRQADNRRVEPKEAPMVKATNDTFDPKSFLAKVGEAKPS